MLWPSDRLGGLSVGEAGPESAARGPRSLSGPGWRRFPVQRGWRAGGPERRRRRPPTDNESGGALLSGGGESDAGPGGGAGASHGQSGKKPPPGTGLPLPCAALWPALRAHGPAGARCACAHSNGPFSSHRDPGVSLPHRHLGMPLPHCDPTHPSPIAPPDLVQNPLESISASRCHPLHTGEFFASVVYPHCRGILGDSAWPRAP